MLETNRIYNMDCLEGIKKIETGSVKLVATDPPYFQGFTHNGQKGAFNDLAISRPFFAQLAQEFARILSEDGEFYIFCDWRGYAFYYGAACDSGRAGYCRSNWNHCSNAYCATVGTCQPHF